MHGKGTDVGRAGRETGTNNQWPGSEQLLLSTWGTLSFSISPVTPHGRSPRGKVSRGCGEARTFRHRAPSPETRSCRLARAPAHHRGPSQGVGNTKTDRRHLAQTCQTRLDTPRPPRHEGTHPHPASVGWPQSSRERGRLGHPAIALWGCAKSSLPKTLRVLCSHGCISAGPRSPSSSPSPATGQRCRWDAPTSSSASMSGQRSPVLCACGQAAPLHRD